jgi:site-specific recombinase XerD
MSQTAVRKALKKYAEKANEINTSCPINLHPHQLRHAKATHLLEDGLSDVIVAEFLGHSGLETIQDYIDVSIEQSRKSLNTLKDEQDRNLRKKWKKAERGNSIRIIAGTMK